MKIAAGLAVVALLVAAGASAAQRAPTVVTRAGITAMLPQGWRVLHRRLTPCTDPVERFTLRGRGALVMLQERAAGGSGFPLRPDRFTLEGKAQSLECCAPLGRPGWFIPFRDAGRGFYLYVYVGERGTRAEALGIADGLRIRPRGRSDA